MMTNHDDGIIKVCCSDLAMTDRETAIQSQKRKEQTMILSGTTNTESLGTFTLLLLKADIEEELKKRNKEREDKFNLSANKLMLAMEDFVKDAPEDASIYAIEDDENEVVIKIRDIVSIYSDRIGTGIEFDLTYDNSGDCC